MNRRDFVKQITASAGAALGVVYNRNTAAFAAESIMNLQLTGSPRNRGHIQGETLRTRIQEILAGWRDMLHKSTGINPTALIQDMLVNTRFRGAIEAYTPELWEELAGMAEAAAVSLDDLFIFNLPDEQRWYLQAKAAGMHLSVEEKCTTVGFDSSATSPALIGQNMDIASGSKGYEVLLDIRDEERGLQSYLFTIVGLIGVVGMNNKPVGIANNSLRQLDGRMDGLPVNFLLRGLLTQATAEEAVAFLKLVPHANGHNWMIGDRDRVRSFECSGKSVVEFDAPRFPGLVYHTNHPFVNTDTELFDKIHAGAPLESGSSEARCVVLEKALATRGDGPPSVEFIKAILSNRDNADLPICRPHNAEDPGATYTAASLVMDLGRRPSLHLAPGPPCETRYVRYEFT